LNRRVEERNRIPSQSSGSSSGASTANGRRRSSTARPSLDDPAPFEVLEGRAGDRPTEEHLLGVEAVISIGASIASNSMMPALAKARVDGQPPSTAPAAIASINRDSASGDPSRYPVVTSTCRRPPDTSARPSTNA
jgi:hypothetical protein